MTGITAHVEKPGAAETVTALLEALERSGAEFLLEEKTAGLVGRPDGVEIAELARRVALLVVLGGDGSILRVLHQLENGIPPVFGINLGTLGFLTCLGASEMDSAVRTIIAGDYRLSERTMLGARLERADGESVRFEALNDVVIGRGERSQLVKVRVRIDGEVLTDYYADGLIVSTPTGSTAYSLSAGGAILVPGCGAFAITPICAHVLTNRSVVIGDAAEISVEATSPEQDIFVTADGQESARLEGGDRLIIGKSRRKLSLAMLPDLSFSSVLQQKLKWSGSNV